MTLPDGMASFDVRIIKIADYSLDDIFEKNLLFLIPFYIFHYGTKKQLDELEHNPEKLKILKEELSMIVERLDALTEQKILDMFYYKTILDMSTKVIENLAAGYDNILKGVKGIMGGTILEYEAGTIYGEGVVAGYRTGKADGFRNGEAVGFRDGKAAGFRDGEAAGKTTGFRDGEFNAKLESIKELMKNLKLTAEQAMQAIGIPASEQTMYLKKL
ncbi:MAG: hypothetical protein LUF92_17515 [Clostridiales bacterium]|nr:hypothetical protein [Clostridiales bacterium]